MTVLHKLFSNLALMLLSVLIAKAPTRGEIITCDTECRESEIGCQDADCKTDWKRCKKTCDICTACEFLTRRELRAEIGKFHAGVSTVLVEGVTRHKLESLPLEGAWSNLYDNDESTCMTFSGNENHTAHFSIKLPYVARLSLLRMKTGKVELVPGLNKPYGIVSESGQPYLIRTDFGDPLEEDAWKEFAVKYPKDTLEITFYLGAAKKLEVCEIEAFDQFVRCCEPTV